MSSIETHFSQSEDKILSINQAPYQPTWDSLQQHPVPQWFDDAKFGIYFHWGPYSVPAYDNEWYSRNMYIPGHKANEHHLATYGDLSEFGYKDFIPMFTAEHFDAEEWTDLFQKAGARFVGPVTEHADGYSMWDSQINPFNAAQTGPKRDIVAEMEKAVRARGLNFIATLHHKWLWAWYPTTDLTTDASDPAYASLYGPPTQREDFEDPKPDDAFCDTFVDKIKEVIDGYQPDLLYFDARLDTISERHRQDFVAYYYNKAAEWGREVAVTYKNEDLPEGAGIFDLERGRMSGLRDFKWLTDDSICWNSWADLHEPSYKSVKRLIDGLVDIVSKNGNLLLNIPPTADGRIPDPIRERLLGMGAWLDVNGEAIYGTRPWQAYGEGPTEVFEGHFSEKDNPDLTASDIRFTTKPDALYAIVMGWPEGALHIASLVPGTLPSERIGSVELLGLDGALEWSQDETGLTVEVPEIGANDHAYSFKITYA
jgi:alpha-L-fucosidase